MNKLILPPEAKILGDNVVPFVKPDVSNIDPDWLWTLSEGTVFIANQPGEKDQYGRVHKNPVGLEFHIMLKLDDPDKENRWVKLLANVNADHFQWVNSYLFSKGFSLAKVIMKGEDIP